MSPEQAEGKRLDGRSDIFSFGAVLYEMLTGKRAFRRESTTSTLAAILTQEPDPLSAEIPHDLSKVVTRCLRKDPAHRFQHMADLKVALEELKEESDSGKLTAAEAAARPRRNRFRWLVAAVGMGILVAGYAVFWRARETARVRRPPLRTEFSQLTSHPGIEWFPSLSPDGKWLVYGGAGADGHHIYLQAVGGQNRLDLTRDSTADDDQPAFSPDGERIAFHSTRGGGGIFVMGRTGEAVRRVTSMGFKPAWSPDGAQLAFTTENVELYPQNSLGRSELWTVAVDSGETRRLSVVDAVMASWSPHNLRIAYTSRLGNPVQGDVWTILVTGGTPARVTSDPARDWNPAWSPDGKYLYFASDRSGSMNLWRVPIDEASGETLGEPEPITTPAPYLAHASLSADGKSTVYTSALITANIQRLTLDASGGAQGEPAWVTTGSRRWSSPDPSPDGEWVAFYSLTQPEGQVYMAHPDGTGLRQVTNGATDRLPRWSPDGKWIACFSNRTGGLELWKIRPDGSGQQQLTECSASYLAWSPDGSRMATVFSLEEGAEKTGVLVFDPNRPWKEQIAEVLPLFDPSSGYFLVNSWSPDGRRLAGQVNGERPGIAMYTLASRAYERLTDFGEWPVWLPDSRRVLFVADGKGFFVADTRSRQVQKIFSVTRDVIGPPRLTRDGRTANFSRRVTESDIWHCTFR
jgi:Tol biopolymer transport system component